uniref:Iron-sulfur cluster formation ABC transporter ATP-binding subunit n=1 Tax=Antithamnionella ternifolia TaxID=207919 RepID=A0A4D6WP10_9FLOR|nr:iron-sulfur cluster formation ABC transporter ATP-binding subunit [Antithamnionella ternifolia]
MNNKVLLNINNLDVTIGETQIINGLNLSIKPGETHVIMGKNGSGKSTLAKVIAGHPSYQITNGEIFFNNQNITEMEPENRSHLGIFLAFQYPVEIPGVTNADFLRIAYNAKRSFDNKDELDPLSFFSFIEDKINNIDLNSTFLSRNVNEGFSGGEKKKNEILQMSLLNSKLSILDETDSGLDIDALKTIAKQINSLKTKDNSIILITHYQRLLDYIKPNYIHVMQQGQIVYTGGSDTAIKLEKYGYDYLNK